MSAMTMQQHLEEVFKQLNAADGMIHSFRRIVMQKGWTDANGVRVLVTFPFLEELDKTPTMSMPPSERLEVAKGHIANAAGHLRTLALINDMTKNAALTATQNLTTQRKEFHKLLCRVLPCLTGHVSNEHKENVMREIQDWLRVNA